MSDDTKTVRILAIAPANHQRKYTTVLQEINITNCGEPPAHQIWHTCWQISKYQGKQQKSNLTFYDKTTALAQFF